MVVEKALLKSICSQVFQNFPEFTGQSPKVKSQGENSLLIFSISMKTADGIPIQRTLRVLVDQGGKISKITTSR